MAHLLGCYLAVVLSPSLSTLLEGDMPVQTKAAFGLPGCLKRANFSADLEIRGLGHRSHWGRVIVRAGQEVHVEHLDRVTAMWARSRLEAALFPSGSLPGWNQRIPQAKLYCKRLGSQRLPQELWLEVENGARVRLLRPCLCDR